MDVSSPDLSELSFDDKVALLEEELPTPIRDFLHSPERDATSLRLSQKYRLHADQASVFERAYLYMLLGVNSPHDFVDDLRSAGIDAESTKGLTNDINEEVFKKLLKKEFQEADRPTPVRKPAVPQVPIMQLAPVPPPILPRPQHAPSFNLAVDETRPPEPVLRTMQTDMSAIQHQTTAAPIPFPLPHPAQMTPARSFHSASIPYTMAPTSVEQSKVMETPLKVVPSKPISAPPIVPVMNTGGDPYREPV